MASLFQQLTVAALLLAVTPIATGQDNQDGENPREQRGNDRQSRWYIPDDANSGNSRRLRLILQQYPASDADKDGKLTATEARAFIEKQREQWRQRGNWRRNRIEPTFDNVKYGPDNKHHFDFYRAEAEGPTPLVIFFHGGQFITGDERSFQPFDIRGLLAAGVSVASIDYREADAAPFPGPFEDAEMAVQFIRFYAEQLHIDPARVGGMGDEAGGNLALYLALQDDLFDQETLNKIKDGTIEDPREALADGPIRWDNEKSQVAEPESTDKADESEASEESDPGQEFEQEQRDEEETVDSLDDILLEELIPWDTDAIKAASTKLKAAVALHPIATFDPRAWAKHKLPMNGHERLMTKYLDVRYLQPLNDPDVIETVERISPLALITPDDPPLLLISLYEDLALSDKTVWTIMRHHPKQAQLIGSVMRAKGNEVIIRYKGMRNEPGVRSTDFLIERLK